MQIIAIVDPEMMSSMPKGLTASTGMDALTHAIEGYTTKAAWEMTDMFHLKAIELISKSLRGAVYDTPHGVACAPGNPKDASVEDLTALFRKIM